MTSGGGAVLQPGTSTNLIISRWKMIRQPAPYTSNCSRDWGPEFSQFSGNRSYDSKLCQSFCFSKVLINLCDCEMVKMMEVFPGKFNILRELLPTSLVTFYFISDEGIQRNFCNLLNNETMQCMYPILISDDFENVNVYVPHSANKLITKQKGKLVYNNFSIIHLYIINSTALKQLGHQMCTGAKWQWIITSHTR